VQCHPILENVEAAVKARISSRLDSTWWKATMKATCQGYILNSKYLFKLYDELVKALPLGHITTSPAYLLVGIYGTSFTLTVARFEDPTTIYSQDVLGSGEAEVLRPCYARVYVMSTASVLYFSRYVNSRQAYPLTAELNASSSKMAVFRLKSNATTTPVSMSRNGHINGNGDLDTLVEVLKALRDELVCILIDATAAHELISTLTTF